MDAQQFLAEFAHIANAPGGVSKLRELILQLAISGRLTERVVDDTSALELIEANKSSQKALVAQKLLKRQLAPKPVTDSDHPWILPEGWAWTRLGSVTNYGDAPKIELEGVKEDTWVLELEDVEKGTSKLLSKVFARERRFKSTKNVFPAGSVLYGKLRPYLDKVLIADSPGVCTTEISPISFFEHIDASYLRWYLKSPYFIAYADGSTYGMNLPRLGTDAAREALFAFPPQKEQSRIVAKVDELMSLCDKLEDEQQKRRKLQNSLRQATLQAVAKAQSPHELQASWARLEANFGRLFSAPEDVAELRGLILDMAMRGYLVHQDNMEESATTLCDDVEDQKRELSKIKKLKLHKSLSQIGEDEIPFIAPKGWKWIRLGQIVELINGDRSKSYPNKDEYVSVGVPWINTGHIEPDGTLTRHHMNFISREKFESLSSGKIELGDLVYCLRGATFGKTAFVTPYEEGAIASSLVIIRPINSSLSRYLYYYLISPLGRSQIYRFDNGTAQPNLSANSVGLFAYPLPPLNEQTRITDKIEQLMRTCDSLELQIRDSCEAAARLATATIASLTGIAIEQEEDEPVKVPQTELISKLRLGQAPSVKAQAPLASLLARQSGELSAQDLWQRYGGEIDAFYAQLKTEVAHGWIEEPAVAEVREKSPEAA
jgi:type I restriction enzyme, S subunit